MSKMKIIINGPFISRIFRRENEIEQMKLQHIRFIENYKEDVHKFRQLVRSIEKIKTCDNI